MKQFVYLICILLIAAACKEVFEAPPQALLQASFYNSTTNKPMNSSITAQAIGLDTAFYYQESLSGIVLPLNIKDTTQYIIWFDTNSDSITFIHEKTLKNASMESGYYYEYKLLEVGFSHNRIDSIKIVDSLVTKKWNENIKLYLHPLTAVSN